MSIFDKVMKAGGTALQFAGKGGNPYLLAGGLALGALRKPIGGFIQRNTGVGSVDPTTNMRERLLSGDVGRLLEQREDLAQQMIAGVPQQQQQQIYGTAQDEAAALNRQAQQNLAMQGMGGGGNYGNMLEQITQNRMRGGAAQQIANLQPQYMQQGMNMLDNIQGTYGTLNELEYNTALDDYNRGQRFKSNLFQGVLESGPGLLKKGIDLYKASMGGGA
jgi:hypothetical protein